MQKLNHYDFLTLSQKGQEPIYAAWFMQKPIVTLWHPMCPFETIPKIESLGGKEKVKLYLQQMWGEQANQVLDKIIARVNQEHKIPAQLPTTSQMMITQTISRRSSARRAKKEDNAAVDAPSKAPYYSLWGP